MRENARERKGIKMWRVIQRMEKGRVVSPSRSRRLLSKSMKTTKTMMVMKMKMVETMIVMAKVMRMQTRRVIGLVKSQSSKTMMLMKMKMIVMARIRRQQLHKSQLHKSPQVWNPSFSSHCSLMGFCIYVN